MTKNQYVFNTTLEGFVNVFEPSGKYNNCAFSFKLPDEVMGPAEKDREELLAWAKTKVENPKRIQINRPKWDDEGLVSYSFLGETGRGRPVFVDCNGDPVEPSVLKSIRKGTKVRLVVKQTPYTRPNLGTTLKVSGGKILQLATGNGATDSGELSVDDINALLGTETEGYKQSSPAVKKDVDAAPCSVEPNYDF